MQTEMDQLQHYSTSDDAAQHHHHHAHVLVGAGGPLTWLSTASIQHAAADNNNFQLHLQTNSDSSNSLATTGTKRWMSPEAKNENRSGGIGNNVGGGFRKEEEIIIAMSEYGGANLNWETAGPKAHILSHPLYEQLLAAHVSCLRIATPVDQLPRIDAQLAQSQNLVAKYAAAVQGRCLDDKELSQFMSQYVLLLSSFKEKLQQHVRVHAMEAVMACWEQEQALQNLTGVPPGEGTGATMSDDEDDYADGEMNMFDGGMGCSDNMGFGPLVPTDSERSMMERVRQELKHELKQGYKDKIVDIREEILRKRRAGKLPGDTTTHLKTWRRSHSKWPYPTKEDKARLVQETGLQLKQINNWFINQRKRNWHSNTSTPTTSKSKRKSNAGETSNNDRFR